MEVKFVPFDRQFLNASFIWLQDQGLLELIDAVPVSKEDQEKWFQQLETKSDYFIWGVSANDLPVGVCGIKHVAEGKGEYWGYIGNKDYWGKGIGTQMITYIESFARSLGLTAVMLKVLISNERAYRLYLSKGYHVFEQHGNTIYMKKEIGYD